MTQMEKVESETVAGFRGMMRRFPATVSILTANDGTRDHGMTVTALTSVSMDPPSLVTCVNNRTLMHEMLLERPNFAVNVLDSSQVELSNAFSGGMPPEERFNLGEWERNHLGILVLKSAHANGRLPPDGLCPVRHAHDVRGRGDQRRYRRHDNRPAVFRGQLLRVAPALTFQCPPGWRAQPCRGTGFLSGLVVCDLTCP